METVHISELRGKLEDFRSISTSCKLNPGCAKRSMIKNSICEKCFALASIKVYKNLEKALERNSNALTSRIIPTEELPVINDRYFRFESHGDLYPVEFGGGVQLQNYVNIAIANPGTKFTLWTKEYPLAEKFFSENKKPSNFRLIYSSLIINQPLKKSQFKHCDKTFTVWSKVDKTVVDIWGDDKSPYLAPINCGTLKCRSCLKCYHPKNDGIKEINESLNLGGRRTREG